MIQILGFLGMYFDAVVVEVKTFLLLFTLALAILCFCNNIDGLHPMRISTIHENAYDGFIDLIQEQVIFVEIDALVRQLNQSMKTDCSSHCAICLTVSS